MEWNCSGVRVLVLEMGSPGKTGLNSKPRGQQRKKPSCIPGREGRAIQNAGWDQKLGPVLGNKDEARVTP